MAMENFFQVSSVCSSTRAGMVQCYQPFSSKIHLMITSNKGLNKSNLSFTSSYSSLSHPLMRNRSRNSLIVCKAGEAVDEVQVVTDSSWESLVISSKKPVLVEFWAPWCGPCRMIAPVIEELAKEYTGKVACFKLNTDDSPNIATEYGIRSIPTVLFFKNENHLRTDESMKDDEKKGDVKGRKAIRMNRYYRAMCNQEDEGKTVKTIIMRCS